MELMPIFLSITKLTTQIPIKAELLLSLSEYREKTNQLIRLEG